MVAFLIGWIVKLEINAAEMYSRWAELKKSLDQNKDELMNLDSYLRSSSHNYINMTRNDLEIFSKDNMINLSGSSGKITNRITGTEIEWGQNKIDLKKQNKLLDS